ncbi:MAG TPA: hypothetical protein VF898_04415 [Chloroflexota bacterium]
MNSSGQLDVVDLLREQQVTADDALASIEDQLNVQIDANPDDKLLMEMLDIVSDARESLMELRDLFDTVERRDQENEGLTAPPGTPVEEVETIPFGAEQG